MNHKDEELMEETYSEMLNEGGMDRFKANNNAFANKWKGKTFSKIGKMAGSDTLKRAGEEFADKATGQRTDYMTNKFAEQMANEFTDKLKDSIQEFNIFKSEVERKYEDMQDDLKKLNLTDEQRDQIDTRFDGIMQTHFQNLDDIIKTLTNKQSTIGVMRNTMNQKKLTTPAPVEQDAPQV